MSTNVEIERKFLVDPALLPHHATAGGKYYFQGYFKSEPSVRVRLSGTKSQWSQAWLTIKGKGLMTRSEFEYVIPVTDAQELMKMCSCSLTKIRRVVRVKDHCWDVDEFTGPHAGLWMAEIELDSEDEEFQKPSWAHSEVTSDSRYTNAALAKIGKVP